MEQDVYEAVRSEDRLPPAARDESLRYLEGFYEIIRDPTTFDSETAARCRER